MMSLIRLARTLRRGLGAWSARAARPAVACALLIAAPPWDGASFLIGARAQPALTTAQAEALDAYNKALNEFRSILNERRAQIDQKQPLPDLPGQAIYLARNNMISAY